MSQTKSQKLYMVRLRLPNNADTGDRVHRDVHVKAADNITAQRRAIKRNPIAEGIISCVEIQDIVDLPEVTSDAV